jgi:hypothetical protein
MDITSGNAPEQYEQLIDRLPRTGQSEIARHLGVSRQLFNDWRHRRKKPSLEQYLALEAYMDKRHPRRGSQLETTQLTEQEQKFARLMLNKAAAPGEMQNAAIKFVESLRRRKVRSLVPRKKKASRFSFSSFTHSD